ncbi:PPE family protein [Mycobacterium sp. M1]|uniref:PPE family protein n=1 Tax=Mycolicibacter acidiphilus TaxID=2835306 RepID=A0ABS5RPD1_9MYCO|nr:PPE family protein [Mycolicibacter acidiphilus]MBS9535371.1 PPE family protein [Mycolicibacter acidiphilus]
MLDFGILPPEIISTQVYTGPGSAPLLAAAAAWDSVSGQLNSFALGYTTVLTGLQDDGWTGASAAAMAAAAAPYIAWVTETAALTEQSANQARSAAAAYETARAAIVPPAVVAANRALLAALVASNIVGQNIAAIADAETAYSQMWAQDSAAMHGYATAASVAVQLNTFHEPPQTTNAAAAPTQALAPAQALASSAASQTSSSMADQVVDGVGKLNTMSGPVNFGSGVSRTVTSAGSFFTALAKAVGGAAPKAAAAAAPAAAAAASTAAAVQPGPALVRQAVLADFGKASPVGQLSVPKAWADATPIAAATEEPLFLAEAELAEVGSWGELPASGMMGAAPAAAMGAAAGVAGRSTVSSILKVGPRRFTMPRHSAGG